VVLDDVLPLSWARSVQDEVVALERSGSMRQTSQQGYGVRQDKVTFLVSASLIELSRTCTRELQLLGTVLC
jgi:hypothetical protein